MGFWIIFWTITLIVSATIFAVLAVVVTFGGFFDILTLIKKLKHPADSADTRRQDTD